MTWNEYTVKVEKIFAKFNVHYESDITCAKENTPIHDDNSLVAADIQRAIMYAEESGIQSLVWMVETIK